jgi:Acetyltransferase (GNAT) domain
MPDVPCSAPNPHALSPASGAAIRHVPQHIMWSATAIDRTETVFWPMKRARLMGILPVLQAPRVPRYDINGGPMAPDCAAEASLRGLLLSKGIPKQWPRVIVANAVIAEGPVWDALTALAAAGEIGLTEITTWERSVLERDAASGADAYLATFMSGSQRKRKRQQRHALEQAGPLTLTVASGPDDVAAGIAAFCALEQAGWKGRNGTALAQDAAGLSYVTDVMLSMARDGSAFTAALTCGEHIIAAGLFLKAEGEAVFWKTSYDESLSRHSPGVIFDIMLTEWLYGQPWFRRLDSGHDDSVDPASLIWKQRRRMANIVIDLNPGSIRGRFVVMFLRLRARLRAWKNRRKA